MAENEKDNNNEIKYNKDIEDYRNESYFQKAKKDKNFLGIYNIVRSGFVVIALQNAINDYFYDGRSQYGFKILKKAFGSYKLQFILFLATIFLHFLIYYYWKLRIKFRNIHLIPRIEWKHIWSVIVFFQLIVGFNVLGIICINYKIPVGCRFILLWKHLNLSVKAYAFITSNMNILKERRDKYSLPTFSHYAYFTFIPTLVYKEQFLRSTTKRSWRRALGNASGIFWSLYFLGLLFTMYIEPKLKDFGKHPFSFIDIIYNCLALALPSYFCILLMHNILINNWPNFFSEVFSFGERKWHSDWWISCNSSQFYNKWNNFVQDSIHMYVYRDLKHITNNKFLSRFGVLVFSIIWHELFQLYTTEVITLFFVFSMLYSITLYSHPDSEFYNYLLQFHIYIACSFIVGLHFMEMFAKENCANKSVGIIYLPRLWYCETN